MDKQYDKRITRAQRRPEVEIHIDLLKVTREIISNWKTPDYDEIQGFWFKKFNSIHDRLALEINRMNRCLQGAHVEWRKERPHWSKRTQERNCPK